VYSHLRYSQLVTSNGKLNGATGIYTPFTLKYEIGTQYPCAWGTYFNNLIYNASGLPSSSFTLTAGLYSSATHPHYFMTQGASCTSSVGSTSVLTVSVNNVNFAQVYIAGVQIGIGVGAT
jgi:hypothetical protein